jgi:glycosyltransferase involved in cell wall biosynthesis
LKGDKVKIFHGLSHELPHGIPRSIKRVVTIHDLIVWRFPQFYSVVDRCVHRSKIRHSCRIADVVVAVSEQTKKDLMRIMNIPEQKITVVYHGADESPYIPSADSPYDFEYILYVGERHFYKNFIFFCRDCMPILKRHKNLKVICTGVPFTWEENYFIAVFGMEDRFIQTFVQSDQEFMDLYHHAVAFVYPSEYEGFGIPILEAYKADCPVMLNRRSCFPEIAGDAAVYFNLDAYESDFEEQFETLYHLDGNEREALLVKQRERLKRYSWTKSAQQLADVYRKLA